MDKVFVEKLFAAHVKCPDSPGPAAISGFFKELLGTLFPDFSKKTFTSPAELELHLLELKMQLGQMIFKSSNTEQHVEGNHIATRLFEVV